MSNKYLSNETILSSLDFQSMTEEEIEDYLSVVRYAIQLSNMMVDHRLEDLGDANLSVLGSLLSKSNFMLSDRLLTEISQQKIQADTLTFLMSRFALDLMLAYIENHREDTHYLEQLQSLDESQLLRIVESLITLPAFRDIIVAQLSDTSSFKNFLLDSGDFASDILTEQDIAQHLYSAVTSANTVAPSDTTSVVSLSFLTREENIEWQRKIQKGITWRTTKSKEIAPSAGEGGFSELASMLCDINDVNIVLIPSDMQQGILSEYAINNFKKALSIAIMYRYMRAGYQKKDTSLFRVINQMTREELAQEMEDIIQTNAFQNAFSDLIRNPLTLLDAIADTGNYGISFSQIPEIAAFLDEYANQFSHGAKKAASYPVEATSTEASPSAQANTFMSNQGEKDAVSENMPQIQTANQVESFVFKKIENAPFFGKDYISEFVRLVELLKNFDESSSSNPALSELIGALNFTLRSYKDIDSDDLNPIEFKYALDTVLRSIEKYKESLKDKENLNEIVLSRIVVMSQLERLALSFERTVQNPSQNYVDLFAHKLILAHAVHSLTSQDNAARTRAQELLLNRELLMQRIDNIRASTIFLQQITSDAFYSQLGNLGLHQLVNLDNQTLYQGLLSQDGFDSSLFN